MAKQWVLNNPMKRVQLNFKRNVGPTSESICQCGHRTVDEWREQYFGYWSDHLGQPDLASMSADLQLLLCEERAG